MSSKSSSEYCLIVEGNYLDESEAEHALRDPFIEEWVEQTGKFRIHNFDDIEVAGGLTLGDLVVRMIDDEIFEVKSNKHGRPITRHKADLLVDALRRQDMFDEIRVQEIDQVTV